MSARTSYRAKPKKRPNRYNPNKPDWNEVHLPAYMRPGNTIANDLMQALGFTSLLNQKAS